jgi:hypothetical protein
MATKMVCNVQGTSNLAEWVCDKCGFGWVASEVLNCKVCILEADLELARKERRDDLGIIISKSNKIIELATALKSSEEIRRAEKKILLEEIQINQKLRSTIVGLKIDVEVAESLSRHSPSPCGHSSQYAYSKDGGKHIVCLLCSHEHKEKLANAAREVVRISDREHDAWQLLKKRLAEV